MKKNLLRALLILLWSLATASTGSAQEANQDSALEVQVSPMVRYSHVDGDQDQFREDWWIREDVAGGIEGFNLKRKFGDDISLYVEGRAIVPEEDYKIKLNLTKEGVGFFRAGYTEYRKWYDDTGGFYELFNPSSFDLNKDLHLDIGDIFVEIGMTLPDLPRIVLGYERRFKDGNKSLLEWGSVTQGDITRKIFPSYKDIDEHVDIFKLDADYTIGNVHLGDKFRYEHYETDTVRYEEERDLNDNTAETVTVFEDYKHDAFYNTFHMDSRITEKIYWSLGYLYNSLSGDASFRMFTVPFGPEPRDKDWFSQSIDVDQDSHVVNVNGMFGPFKELTFYGGIQAETTDSKGDTDAILRETIPNMGVAEPNAVIVSDTDKSGFEEQFGVRYAGIPYTTIYAEGRWTQQNFDLFERELEDDELSFERSTDTDVTRQRYSIGFNTSPISKVRLSARYRRGYRSNDYDNQVDTEPGYSAFIEKQDFDIEEIYAKVSYRPFTRLQTSFQYQHLSMDIDTETDTSPSQTVTSGNYDADIYSLNITLTPLPGLYFSALFSYRSSSTFTFDNGALSVIPYDNDYFAAMGTAGYAFDEKTDITLQYLYTQSNNFEDNSENGLPLGIDNQRHRGILTLSRRLKENLHAKMFYGFYKYDEDSNGGIDNYEAHLIGTSWVIKF